MGTKHESSKLAVKHKVTRKGVHAKKKTSKIKSSKLYKKINVGQGH